MFSARYKKAAEGVKLEGESEVKGESLFLVYMQCKTTRFSGEMILRIAPLKQFW